MMLSKIKEEESWITGKLLILDSNLEKAPAFIPLLIRFSFIIIRVIPACVVIRTHALIVCKIMKFSHNQK